MRNLPHPDAASASAPRLTGNRCLCRGCNRYFSTVANFDRHRRGGQCLDPKDAGLVLVKGIWKRPDSRTTQALARQYGRTTGVKA